MVPVSVRRKSAARAYGHPSLVGFGFVCGFEARELRAEKIAMDFPGVDAELDKAGWSLEKLPDGKEAARIGRALGAQAVLFGKVTQWGRLYAGVHSQVRAGLRLELVDCDTGVSIWQGGKEDQRNAGLLKLPTGVGSAAVAPLMGLRDKYLEECAHNVARLIAEDLVERKVVILYAEHFSG